MLTEGKQFRFCFGTQDDPCSSVWRIWTQGDEAYVAVRNFITVAKLSLHSTGYWQFRADRLVAAYRRPRPYQPGWTRGPGILVPHNDLDMRLPYYDPRPRDHLFWLPQPESGKIAQVAMHFVAPDVPRESWMRGSDAGLSLLAALRLRAGGRLCVFRADRPFTSDEVRRIAERRAILEPKQPATHSGRIHGISIVSMEADAAGQPLMFETQFRPVQSAPGVP